MWLGGSDSFSMESRMSLEHHCVSALPPQTGQFLAMLQQIVSNNITLHCPQLRALFFSFHHAITSHLSCPHNLRYSIKYCSYLKLGPEIMILVDDGMSLPQSINVHQNWEIRTDSSWLQRSSFLLNEKLFLYTRPVAVFEMGEITFCPDCPFVSRKVVLFC